jgi:hypothetical protein
MLVPGRLPGDAKELCELLLWRPSDDLLYPTSVIELEYEFEDQPLSSAAHSKGRTLMKRLRL